MKRTKPLPTEGLFCRDCQAPFKPKDGRYKRVGEAVICRDRPTCRARQLAVIQIGRAHV